MDFHSLSRKDLQFLCKKNRIPANLTNVAMAKALEALETVEGIEEIQEALGFQSPKVNSPDLPHTGRRTSVRRAGHGEEPKIQQQKQSPQHRSRRAVAKDLEVTEMAFEEEEGEKKEVPKILPKTPAARKAVKGVEAQSSRRMAKKKEENEGGNETPKAVEAKERKAFGVITRRSTRLSSRKALEETATTQSKSRSSSRRENAAVKMEALAKADMEEQEKEEEKKDLVEYGDSCAVLVEEHGKEEDEEAGIHEFSSPIDGEVSMTTKALEATKMVSKEEEDNKKEAPKLLSNTRRSTRLSSRTVKMVVLAKEDAEQEKEEEKKDIAEKSDSCVIIPVEEDEEKDQKVESHGFSSSIQMVDSNIEVENDDDSKVVLVEEDENNDQEVEIHGFSSSIEMETSKVEVENDDSTVVDVEGDEKNDQELEIHVFSSSIEGENSIVELENNVSNVVLVEEEGWNDQEESHGDQPPVNEYLTDASDQSPENNLAEDSSNQKSEFIEVSGDLLPENEVVEDSDDHSPENEAVEDSISAASDNLLCSEISVVCTQGSSGIEEEEEGQLSLLFTEMTLREEEERCHASYVSAKLQAAMVISAVTNLGNEASPSEIPAAIEESIDDDLSDAGEHAMNDSIDVQVVSFEISQGSSFEPQILVSSTELCAEFSVAGSTNEFTDEVKENSGDLPSEFPAVIQESVEDNLTVYNDSFDVLQKAENFQGSFFEPQIPDFSSELCSEFSTADSTIEFKEVSVDHQSEIPDESVEDCLHELAANESFDVPHKTEISQGGTFEPQSLITELCSEFSTVESAVEFKEAFGDLPSEISAVIDESIEADLPNSAELAAEKSVDAETSQDGSFEPQIPVHSSEFCVEFSATVSSSPLKLPCESETTTMSLEELSIVQTQTQESEESGLAATEIVEEKEETKTKALEKEENLELLSLTKLRAMYKQMLNNGTKNEETKKSAIKQEDLECLSCIKHDENCKQKLNDDMIKLEKKRSVIKKEDLECLSRSKLDSSNCKQKLNDDKIKSERKRTPLKNLNYSTF